MAKIKPKFIVIDETPIQDRSSNGGRFKEIIFKNDKDEKFKLAILSESYVSQSYARLYKWTTENGFEIIKSKNPMKDFKIDISYRAGYLQSSFDPIVKDMMKLAEHF